MPTINFMNSFANPFIKILARSPLHNLVDKGVILITYTGRKSGKKTTVPVNYLATEKTIHVISLRNRNWWRNLKGGALVEVMLKGKKRDGWAVLMDEQAKVIKELDLYCRQNPKYAQFLNIGLDAAGFPIQKDLIRAAK